MENIMIDLIDLPKLNRRIYSEIEESLKTVINSGVYNHGEQLKKFEAEFAQFCGT